MKYSHVIGFLLLTIVSFDNVSFGKKLCFLPKVILSFSFEEKDNVSLHCFTVQGKNSYFV